MKQIKTIATCAAMALLLSACGALKNQDIGVITGGVLGGALGNQIGGGTGKVIATIGGTLVGAMIGGSIGHSMDEVDRMKANRALEKTPTDRSYSWTNPDTHASYTVTPTKTYYHKRRPCRTYVMTALIDGKAEKIKGRACRQRNGTWKQVS